MKEIIQVDDNVTHMLIYENGGIRQWAVVRGKELVTIKEETDYGSLREDSVTLTLSDLKDLIKHIEEQ